MRRSLILCAVVAAASVAHADDWAAPTTKYVKSDSARYRGVVTPGAAGRPGRITLYDDRDPTRRKRLYQRRPVNEIAPVQVLLSDGGQLVTVDEWQSAGYKHALVLYDRRGRVLLDCQLEEILLPEEMASVEQSESSRWWRAKEHAVWLDGGAVHLKSAWGPVLRFDLATGAQTRDGERVSTPGLEKCRKRARSRR